jgi:hypothetical protein
MPLTLLLLLLLSVLRPLWLATAKAQGVQVAAAWQLRHGHHFEQRTRGGIYNC